MTMTFEDTSFRLLVGLFLTSYLCIHDSNSIENGRTLTNNGTMRPEVTIPQGKLRGINMVTRNKRTVSGFVGIPYAEPPIGELRFRAPIAAGPWAGTLDAGSDFEPCPQFNDYGIFVGTEDCLYLNVFTPKLARSHNSKLLPVMVYIIGGAYFKGNISTSRYGPDFILDEDVVLVIPSFRLGVLGYLTTGDEIAPGNYALKDMVRALEWTQKNIEYFGGDPNQVTLCGGSSGASSVHILALSNLTEGLFHRMITQSGSALDPKLNFSKNLHANRTIKLGKHFGCPTNTSKLLVDCLRRLNASQLVDSDSIFYAWRNNPRVVWLPTYEVDTEGALLTDTPANLIKAGHIRDIPWISGVNTDEGLGFALDFYEDPDAYQDLLNNVESFIPVVTSFEGTAEQIVAYTSAVKSYYLNDLSANRHLLMGNITQIEGDGTFVYPAYKALRQQLLHAKSPQYFCYFKYRGTLSHTYFFSGGSTKYTGVSHGDEIIYLFRDGDSRFGLPDYQHTETDWKMVDTMVQLWTSFATNGTPTTIESKTIWEPYSSHDNYLRIGEGSDPALEMEYNFLPERMRFWEELSNSSASTFKIVFPLMSQLVF